MRKQTPPFSVQIEFTEGCNLGCSFCGLQGVKKNGKGPFIHMEQDTLSRILSEIKRVEWNVRFIVAMHGEPTLNPNFLQMLSQIRQEFPKSIISIMTNGYWIVRQPDMISAIQQIKNTGLNDLILDSYSDDGDAVKIDTYLQSHENDFELEHLNEKGVTLYGKDYRRFRILVNPPIQENTQSNRHLCNHCGAAAPLDHSCDNKRCARPFREIAFRHDGSVAICCNDFRGEYPIGNVLNISIDDIWYSPKMESARKFLYNKDRSFKPCYGCNAISTRVGLLPDKLGKETVDTPTDNDRKIVTEATNTRPLSTINVREWDTDYK